MAWKHLNPPDVLTRDVLCHYLSYDPETGIFIRRVSTAPNALRGMRAGNVSKNGYRVVRVANTEQSEHRLAWLYQYGVFPRWHIDHIDGNRANNAIANLRDVPQQTNRENLRAALSNNQTGVLGVHTVQRREGVRYQARIQTNRRKINLGCFDTIGEAEAAYLRAKRELHLGCTI